MLIALLAILGVNLIVVAALLAFVLSRKLWVKRQPGSFRGVIRVSGGQIDGLRSKWGRGYGRWVRDVLVWTKAPFLFRNELMAADGLEQQRLAVPDEVKRLGDHPAIVRLRIGGATVEVAAHDDERDCCSARTERRSTPRWLRRRARSAKTDTSCAERVRLPRSRPCSRSPEAAAEPTRQVLSRNRRTAAR